MGCGQLSVLRRNLRRGDVQRRRVRVATVAPLSEFGRVHSGAHVRPGILDVTPAVPGNLPGGWLVGPPNNPNGGRTRMAAAAGASRAVRIANCSGFYGDRLSAMREMLTGGVDEPVDYLTGDYLAELTMLILGRDRMKHPERGYAKTFLTQLEDCLGEARDRGVRIVANAGGLNPAGLADAIRALAERLGGPVQVAHVGGDDILAP